MANVRIQLDFDEAKVRELDQLQKICHLTSRKELVNNALTLLQWAVRQVVNGRIIASVDETNQKYRELQLPALMAASQRQMAEAAAELVAKPATQKRGITTGA